MACANYLNSEALSALETGKGWHRDIRASFLQAEDVPYNGLPITPEGPETFTTEKAITDENGKVVTVNGKMAEPDKVDYRTHEIFEIKPYYPNTKGETHEDAYYRNQAQIERYIATYEKARGVTPVVHLICYEAD